MAGFVARKFYIVDDDPVALKTMARLLEARGHEVSINGTSANAMAEIIDERPYCILTDLVMPGVDGLELVRQLRGRTTTSGMKIIVVTSKGNDLWRQRAEQAGANGFLLKPLDLKSFASQVEEIIAAE